MPRRVAVIGPIVEPHGMLLRLTRTPATARRRLARLLERAAVVAEVAYRWLELILIAGPALTIGRWPGSWRSG
jgi:hypothetical protein